MANTLTYTGNHQRTLAAGQTFTDGKRPLAGGRSLSNVTYSLSTAEVPAAAGGADLAYSEVLSITGAGTATIDLRNFTDVLGRTAKSFARIKSIEMKLLGTADTVATGVVGTAASSVTVGNSGTNDHQLFLGADAQTVVLTNRRRIVSEDESATGMVVDASNKNVLFTNDDALVTAKVLVQIVGGSV